MEDCAICLYSLHTDPTTNLPCNHILHTKCIKNLTSSTCPSKNNCPICRIPFRDNKQIKSQSQEQLTLPLPLVQAMLFSFSTLIYI